MSVRSQSVVLDFDSNINEQRLYVRRFHGVGSVYSLPGECSDLFLCPRIRPHDNSQFVAGYLELAHEILAHINGRERAFEMVSFRSGYRLCGNVKRTSRHW
jgi:hypothetical protein